MILAGDIGGTRTRLALFEDDDEGGRVRPVRSDVVASREASSLDEIIERFLAESGKVTPRAACLGVAGAIVDGETKTTNLPWQVSQSALSTSLGIDQVHLMNDLEAAAHGVLALRDESKLAVLQEGVAPKEPSALALVAAGTGLGVAIMAWTGEGYRVTPSEGGHVSFAPQTPVEDALLLFLRAELGHVSYERIASGPGLVNIYRFLRQYRDAPEPAWLTDRIGGDDAAPVISAAAMAREDPVCEEALDLFVSVFGAAAGNVALTALAVGGVYIGGGITPKILPSITDGPFLESFAHKGRFADRMRRIPLRIVLDPDIGLLGAAMCVRGG